MNKDRQNEFEHSQRQEHSRRIRNARKKREEEKKKEAEKKKEGVVIKIGKMRRLMRIIRRYRFLIMLISSPMIFLILIALIIGFMVVYCSNNMVECGWETTKETVETIAE